MTDRQARTGGWQLEGYSAEAYERLGDLKDEYDPTNLFSLNQNVAPSGNARADGG